jgi:hypothetical protein
MLIAVLATDNLSEVDQRVLQLAAARPINPQTGKPSTCAITAERTFRGALEAALSVGVSEFTVEVSRRDHAPTARFIEERTGKTWTEFGRQSKTDAIERKAIFRNVHSLALQLEDANS